MPALFTQMSTGPRSFSTRATTSCTGPVSRMSHAYPRAWPPAAVISLAVSSAPSALRSTMASLQPSPASASASALPRLRAAPVTSATLPRMPRSITSPALELRLALAEEGLDALGGVLALERRHERVDLDVERARHRRLQPPVHALDEGGPP